MPDYIRRLLAATACISLAAWHVGPARADFGDEEAELTETTLIVVGGAAGEIPSPTLDRLKERLVSADPESTIVIFTGNYSGAGGMPGKTDGDRASVERDVKTHVDAVREFVGRGGRTFFLSGHCDYEGRKDVRRLRKFINHELNAAFPDDDHHVDVMPNADCGEPTTVELGEFGVLALINSPGMFVRMRTSSPSDPRFTCSDQGRWRRVAPSFR